MLTTSPCISGFDILANPFEWRRFAPQWVIGVDEVGRGCIAGPVYATACFLPYDHEITGLTDSKLLSELRRDEFYPLIKSSAKICTGFASLEEIESLNILHASLLAMRRAVEGLEAILVSASSPSSAPPSIVVLVDGHLPIPGVRHQQIPLVKGDLRAEPISAAAICAKVERDSHMKELARMHPAYGFEKNKGYGTKDHREAIQKWGVCSAHRRTFRGVVEHLVHVKQNTASI